VAGGDAIVTGVIWFEGRALYVLIALCVAIVGGVIRWLWTKSSGRPPAVEFELLELRNAASSGGDGTVLSYDVINRSDPPIELLALTSGVRYLQWRREVEVELGSIVMLAAGDRETIVAAQANLPEGFSDESDGESGSLLCWARYTGAEGLRWEAVGAPGVPKVQYRRID
jgi:hypothetical protein